MLNQVPRHTDVWEWMFTSLHS